jgi:hypothetical protein
MLSCKWIKSAPNLPDESSQMTNVEIPSQYFDVGPEELTSGVSRWSNSKGVTPYSATIAFPGERPRHASSTNVEPPLLGLDGCHRKIRMLRRFVLANDWRTERWRRLGGVMEWYPKCYSPRCLSLSGRDARNSGEAWLEEQGRDPKCTAQRTNNSPAHTPNTPGRREDVGRHAADAELYQSCLGAE